MLRDPDIESTAGTGAPSTTEASAPAAPAQTATDGGTPTGVSAASPKPQAETQDDIENAALASMGIPTEAAPRPQAATGDPKPSSEAAPIKPEATGRLASLNTPEKRGEYVKASRNLLWAGLSQATIDRMDVADVLTDGKTAAQRRATLDRQRSRKDADPRPADSDSTPASRGRNQEAQPRSQPARDEQTGRFERPSDTDPLDDLIDLEADAVEEAPRRPSPEVERLRRENEEARHELHETWVESAFREAEGTFAQIKDPAQMQRVAQRMAELDPDRSALKEGKAAVMQLVKQACFFEYGEQLIQESRAATREAAESLRDGQPYNAAGRNRPEKPPTIDEIEDAAAAAIVEADGNVDRARQKLGQRFGT